MMRRISWLGLAVFTACTSDPTNALPPPPGQDDASVSASTDDAAAVAANDAAAPRPGDDAAAATFDDAALPVEDAGALPEVTWCRDVAPIIQAKCTLCHGATPAFSAPMSLTSYANTQVLTTFGTKMHERMALRITAPQSPMPPPNQPPLTPSEIQTIVRWSMSGGAEGTCAAPADAGVAPDAAPSDGGIIPGNTHNWEIRVHAPGNPAAPYEMPVDTTNYKCWSFVVPPGPAQQYAVRFEHLIDNSMFIHHTLIFRDRGNNSADGPFDCGSPELDWDMVSGWAPGQPDESMPTGVGVRAFPGDRFVIQAHYDRVTTPGETDASGVRMVITDAPGLSEAVVLWAGGAWINTISGNNVQRRGTCTVRQAMTMFSIFPHMHRLGLRISLEMQRGGAGPWELVGEVPAWSFDDQPKVPIPMQFQQVVPGDKLRTTCIWDTQGRSVSFGEASDAEMCFNFVMHHPPVNNPNTACLMLMQ